MFDFLDRFDLKARPVLTSGETAAFDQVMSGKIDVGWATPPLGVDALEEDRIRIVAKASEVPKIRDKTGSDSHPYSGPPIRLADHYRLSGRRPMSSKKRTHLAGSAANS